MWGTEIARLGAAVQRLAAEVSRLTTRSNMSVIRAKVVQANVNGRTLLQVAGYDQDVFNDVELLLPPGYVAVPGAAADVLLTTVTGTRDHKVALGGDATADSVPGLQPGEIGLAKNGHRIILHADHVEITTQAPVIITSPKLQLGAAGGKKIALDGDPVVNGCVQASSTCVTGT